ncbi:MAG: pyrimidine-nucleoside phosphorylase [Saprospiraceae bacterium]
MNFAYNSIFHGNIKYIIVLVELILKKKEGQILTKDEIDLIVQGYTKGAIPDYQMSALLMAICFQGLNEEETTALTHSMIHSGDVVNLSSIPGLKVDKHSTGGVGDKTTLVLGPLVAAAGVPVAKMSGRGLGHTGGTLDKLESIPGFQINLSSADFLQQVKKIGLSVCAQNDTMVPADKKIYALRDVTGTVDNMSLIASSIMSKKLASGADAIVIDIKIGEGAFMKTIEDAEKLANIMIKTAQKMDKKLVAVITDMNQPLGNAIGNLLEVQEAIDTLKGHGPEDLTEVCLVLGSHMLVLANKFEDTSEAYHHLETLLKYGKAYQKWEEFVKAQGGDVEYPLLEKVEKQRKKFEYTAKDSGYISEVHALNIGKASVFLGAGREKKDSDIDHLAGIILLKKQGDHVQKGDVLATLYAKETSLFEKALGLIDQAFIIGDEQPMEQPLIYKTVV